MQQPDDFSAYYRPDLEGLYECVDRIVLNGYFILAQHAGGMRHWWRDLTGSDETLDDEHLRRMAGSFSRRVHAYGKENGIAVIHCGKDTRKDELAKEHLPSDPAFQGVFLILVAKAPALVWEVKHDHGFHIQRKQPWPFVNHYHFHIMDSDWGHMTIKMSGHPPFGLQIMLNGHEWVQRQALREDIAMCKTDNCFTGGSDFRALDRVAGKLCTDSVVDELARSVDRWVYSACLCFALDMEAQKRSGFRYKYSCHQIEYSRNLLFKRGTMLDEVYQGMIDRTRRVLDVPKLKTIFGWKKRPHHQRKNGKPFRIERVLTESREYDLTVFKVHFGRITLKIYDKGDRVLRVEVVVHNTRELRCGRSLQKMPIMLAKIQSMPIDFLNVVNAAHRSFLGKDVLDSLHRPTQRGAKRLAGVDLCKPRMRAASDAILSLASGPEGFTTDELCEQARTRMPKAARYNNRKAAYDLRKLRGKKLVERIGNTRRYRVTKRGLNTIVAWTIVHEKVIKPVIAGAGKKRLGRPPKNIHPVDQHYVNLHKEMRATFSALGLCA